MIFSAKKPTGSRILVRKFLGKDLLYFFGGAGGDFIYLFFCQYTRPNKKVCGSGYILKKIRVGIFFYYYYSFFH